MNSDAKISYVVDTHALIGWLQGTTAVSENVLETLMASYSAGERIGYSPISLWEIATLQRLKKISLRFSLRTLFQAIEEHDLFEAVPMGAEIILDAAETAAPLLRDPADQIITATARTRGAVLVTADRKIRESGIVTCLWGG